MLTLILLWFIAGLICHYGMRLLGHGIFPESNDFAFHPDMIVTMLLGPMTIVGVLAMWIAWWDHKYK